MTATPARAGLDELDALLAAATPGPWWAWDRGVGWNLCTEDPATVGRGSVPVTLPEGLRTDLARKADAALIVALRNAAPAMVAAIRAAYTLADNWERNCSWIVSPEDRELTMAAARSIRAVLDEALGASGE